MALYRIWQGDITTLEIDAIVNAANETLLGGGGVDGAVHRAAGPRLLEACKELNGCATGEAKITDGFDLPARFVIHTVGPIWQGGDRGEPDALRACYQRSIEIAIDRQLRTLAFPSISTGAYGFPAEKAARVAVAATRSAMQNASCLQEIVFCCFDRRSADLHAGAFNI